MNLGGSKVNEVFLLSIVCARLCCAIGKVEDSIHFLLDCLRFDSVRLQMRQVAQAREAA